jgi:hypothetical protein
MTKSDMVDRLRDETFATPAPAVRIAMSLGPILVFLGVLPVIALVTDIGAASFAAAATLGSFIGAGKLVILAGAVEGAPLNVWALATLVVYADVGTALFVMANMVYLYRVPLVGRWMAATRETGHRVLGEHRWMRRFTWLGVAVFVALPVQGSGGVLGTVIGRLLGLTRTGLLVAVSAGSAVGSYALALLGRFGRSRTAEIASNPLVSAALALVFVAGLVFLGRWLMGKSGTRSN